MPAHRLEPLPLPPTDADLADLADLLADAVDSGAAVSFVQPFRPADAAAWWRRSLADPHPRAVVLVARAAGGVDAGAGGAAAGTAPRPGRIDGAVRLEPAWAPNQPHRAEVCKLLVHRRARGGGLGRRLMEGIESAARAAGFTLLTLDCRAGGPAEALYTKLGWARVGEIPGYAVDADGRGLHATVVYYKRLP